MTIKKEDLELIVSRGGSPGGRWRVPSLGCSRRLVTETAPQDEAGAHRPAALGPGGCGAERPPPPNPPSPARDTVLRPPYGAAAVSLQMTEMEISRAAAERSLREHMGNVVEALITLTN